MGITGMMDEGDGGGKKLVVVVNDSLPLRPTNSPHFPSHKLNTKTRYERGSIYLRFTHHLFIFIYDYDYYYHQFNHHNPFGSLPLLSHRT